MDLKDEKNMTIVRAPNQCHIAVFADAQNAKIRNQSLKPEVGLALFYLPRTRTHTFVVSINIQVRKVPGSSRDTAITNASGSEGGGMQDPADSFPLTQMSLYLKPGARRSMSMPENEQDSLLRVKDEAVNLDESTEKNGFQV